MTERFWVISVFVVQRLKAEIEERVMFASMAFRTSWLTLKRDGVISTDWFVAKESR